MKNYFLFCYLFLVIAVAAEAQITVNVARPVWGPAVTTEEYYYLPEVESYYDIPKSQFVYLNNGVWVRSKTLPKRYKNYNLNKGRVVVINDYHGKSPYVHYKNHKVKYFKNGHRWKGNGNARGNHGNGNAQGNHGNGKGKGNKKEK